MSDRTRSILERARRRPLIGEEVIFVDAVAYRLRNDLAELDVEVGRILYLDRRHIVVADELVAVGCSTHVEFPLRSIVRRGIEMNAASMILVHNHPSGLSRPSERDVEFTRRVVAMGTLIQLPVREHLVVAKDGYCGIRYRRMI